MLGRARQRDSGTLTAVCLVRGVGLQAPPDCVSGYAGVPVKPFHQDHPAREWVASLPCVPQPAQIPQLQPADPLDTSSTGAAASCDCYQPPTNRTWLCETDLIDVDPPPPPDGLIDGNDGQSVYNIVAARGIKTMLYSCMLDTLTRCSLPPQHASETFTLVRTGTTQRCLLTLQAMMRGPDST